MFSQCHACFIRGGGGVSVYFTPPFHDLTEYLPRFMSIRAIKDTHLHCSFPNNVFKLNPARWNTSLDLFHCYSTCLISNINNLVKFSGHLVQSQVFTGLGSLSGQPFTVFHTDTVGDDCIVMFMCF